ncbi:BofC C-terminal domain-containing protein [Pseudalkalibacillus hwajinpoensis]|uniref:BofC C-terminal domain-containing protein n=1 Tax=Guptibacillus hwajinpoensis TaxID=208199 RepID=UPI00325BAEB0
MKNVYLILCLALFLTYGEASGLAYEGLQQSEKVTRSQISVNAPLEVEVILRTNYADGISVDQTVYETIWAMEDFWSQYMDWQLVDQEEGRMIFEKNIEDISPASKENGYFGLTKDGIITIFDGNPSDKKVIQTFFQIDVGRLESKRRDQLMDGIPVESWYQFEDMLQSFYKVKTAQPVR